MANRTGQESHDRTSPSRRETLTTPKVIRVECPVCDGRLKGAALLGYYCTRCGAHYSAPRVRQLQREHLHHTIQTHFSMKRPEETRTKDAPEQGREQNTEPHGTLHEETTHIVIADDDGTITQAIAEARTAVKETTRHLEDILDTQHDDTTTEDTTSEAEDAEEDRTPENDDGVDTTEKDETQSSPQLQPSSGLKTLRRTAATRIPRTKQEFAKTQAATTTREKSARQHKQDRNPRKKNMTNKRPLNKRATKTPITRNSRTTQRANTKKLSTTQSSRLKMKKMKKTAPKRAKQQPCKR